VADTSAVTGPTSNASQPVRTSSGSPDTLPLQGYTIDQLADYVERQLGKPTWIVELTRQQVLDCCQDALNLASVWMPLRRYQSLVLAKGKFRYIEGVDVGQGVADVTFVEPNPVPTEIFYGNLIEPAPLFRLGLDEYDTFLRWRKTWMRVTSVRPDWLYDEYEQCLYIHNPIERYHAGVMTFNSYTDTKQLRGAVALWVKRYAEAKGNKKLGDVWMKYSGAIPGPAQNLQLDAARRDQAQTEMTKLEEELKGMQQGAGISID